MKKTNIIAIITAFIIFIFFGSAYANQVQQNLNEVNKQIKGIQTQIKDKKSDISNINSVILSLDKDIGYRESLIVNVNNQIKKADDDILSLEKEQEINRKNISTLQTNISGRIKAMSKINEMTVVKAFITSNDIRDFLSTVNIMKKIVKQDNQNIADLKKYKLALEENSKKLNEQKQKLSSLKNQYNNEYQKLQEKKDIQNKNIKLLESDLKKLEEMENLKIAESNALTSQIKQMSKSNGYKGTYKGIMKWPLPSGGEITSPYGNRMHPILKKQIFHSGLDIAAPLGSNITAASKGRVIFSGDKGTYGRAVIIDHGSGIVTLYAHCSAIYVNEGQDIAEGQRIAAVGSTGRATGPHLHFEVRKDGITTDPMGYL